MPIKITTTRQSVDAVKMMVFGESGTGKTTLCSTAPKPIIISAEKGLLSLAEFDLPVIEIKTWQEFEEAYDWCIANKDKFDTVCIDSITEVAEIRLAELQAQFADGRKVYGELQSDLPKYIRKFRDIKGKHVFMIAQIDRIEDSYSGISTFRPTMPGKYLVKKLPFFFDNVLCLRIGEINKDGAVEEYRYLQTQPDISYHAKDRSGKLNKIERPNLKMIINKVMGKSTPKKVETQQEEKKNVSAN